MLIAEIAVLLDGLVDDVLQLTRHLGIDACWRERIPIQDLVEHDRRRFASKRSPPGLGSVRNCTPSSS